MPPAPAEEREDRGSWLGGVALFGAVILAIGGILAWPEEPPETEFQLLEVERYLEATEQRGTGGRDDADSTRISRVLAFRKPPIGKPEPLGTELSEEETLTFAYENGKDWERLLVFVVDEHDRFYWYAPEWTEPAANPTSVAIQPGQVRRDLPVSVRHDFEGSWLMIYTIFTDQVVTVRDVEALVRAKKEPGRTVLPDSQEHTLLVRVKRR